MIGDEPGNTIESLDAPKTALRQGEDCPVVGLAAKSVGEPDAGNPHVRFDERGEETERLPIGSKPPRLSSTLHPLSIEMSSACGYGFRVPACAGPGMMGWTAPDGIISAKLMVLIRISKGDRP